MATCITKKRKATRVCIGSLNQQIELYSRAITAPNANTTHYTETFTTVKTVWAMIETLPNVTIFDSSNVERTISHDFYIRFRANINAQNWIKYKGNYYDIVHVENYQERNQFLLLRSNVRGDATKPANFA